MKSLSLFITLLALLCAQTQVLAQASPTVELLSSVNKAEVGKPFKAIFAIEHPYGYWSYYNASSGAATTAKVELSAPEGVSISQPTFSTPTIKWKPVGAESAYNYLLEDTTYVMYEVTVGPDFKASSLELSIESVIQICDKDSCFRPTPFPASITVDIADTEEANTSFDLKQIVDALPAPDDSLTTIIASDGKTTTFTFTSTNTSLKLDQLHVLDRDGFLNAFQKQTFEQGDTNGVITFTHENNAETLPKHFSGILYAKDGSLGKGIQLEVPITGEGVDAGSTGKTAVAPAEKSQMGLAVILLFLFGGGIILNLMPCVFPVIGIKIMGFVQQAGEDKSKIKLHGLIFTAGVLITFLVLALIILPVRELQGQGAQLQNPWVVFVLLLVMLVMGLSMFGLFEIGVSATGAGSKLQSKSGLAGTFFSGVLAVVVATPCSAPLIGPAIGAAWKLEPVFFVISLLTMGLGLSVPYLLLSFFPALVKKLPQPGAWMESFKQGMAFLLIAAAAYLLWVYIALVDDGHSKILYVFLGLVLISSAAWVYGRWNLPYKKKSIQWTGKIVTLILLAGGIAMALPEAEPTKEPGSVQVEWLKWSPEKVEEYQAKGIPVYVDFTARWCATCQTNKLSYTDNIHTLFHDRGVVLMKADWTKPDDRILPTIQGFGRAAIPVNALYVPNGDPQVTSEILTPGYIEDFINTHLPKK